MKLKPLVLIMLLPLFSWADHLVGGDIQYRYIGDSTGVSNHYEIILRLYRDVAGIQLGNTAQNINICSSCFGTDVISIPLVEGGPGHFSPTLFDCVDPAAQGTVNMEYYIYKTDYVLPGNCADFTFSYESCCRNAAIDNIVTPSQSGLMLVARLDNRYGDNSSPYFLSEPVRAFCVGKEFYWQHYASEEDGDSLVYKLSSVKSYTGVCTPSGLSYNSGFSYVQPISTSPPASLKMDAASGMMQFTPSNVEIDVLALEVEEFRFISPAVGWKSIGTSYRDIQITVSPVCKPNVRAGVFLDSNEVRYHFDTGKPIVDVVCHDTLLTLDFGVKVSCFSVTPTGSEFELYSPYNTPVKIKECRAHCDVNNETSSIELVLDQTLSTNGLYLLKTKKGTDLNTLVNKCGFEMKENDSIFLSLSDCKPLGFEISNVTVEQDSKVHLEWTLNTSSIDTSVFTSFRVYRRKKGANNWDLVRIIKDVNIREYTDMGPDSEDLDNYVYEYQIKLYLNNFKVAKTQMKNTILLQGDDVYCDSLYLDWNKYRKRYGGFALQIGSNVSGSWKWSTIPGALGSDQTTLDSSYFVKLRNTEIPSLKLRVETRDMTDPSVSQSNWIDCLCNRPPPVPVPELIVPNAFSPNGDGTNDLFIINGLEYFEENELLIYNRWGNLVFSQVNYDNQNAWDGRHSNGSRLSSGVYMYMLKVRTPGKLSSKLIKGSITILAED